LKYKQPIVDKKAWKVIKNSLMAKSREILNDASYEKKGIEKHSWSCCQNRRVETI